MATSRVPPSAGAAAFASADWFAGGAGAGGFSPSESRACAACGLATQTPTASIIQPSDLPTLRSKIVSLLSPRPRRERVLYSPQLADLLSFDAHYRVGAALRKEGGALFPGTAQFDSSAGYSSWRPEAHSGRTRETDRRLETRMRRNGVGRGGQFRDGYRCEGLYVARGKFGEA